MRKSFTAAVALVAIVATTAPATAAPAKKAPRQESTVNSVRERDNSPAMTAIRKLLKKFGVTIQGLPGGPIPDNDGD